MFDPLWKIFCDSRPKKGQGDTYLAKKYGVAKSTVCRIREKKEIISSAVRDTNVKPGKRQIFKSSNFSRLEKKTWPVISRPTK